MSRVSEAVPPHAWFAVSAVFHYLGPAFAVLLFPVVGVLGVAWFRIASAALVFAPVTKPWRTFKKSISCERILLLALGACLAVMNDAFYLALDRLPIALVAAIEFVGTIGFALWGLRTGRNYLAFVVTIVGVALLTDVPSLLAAEGQALTSERRSVRPLHHPRTQDFRRWRVGRRGAAGSSNDSCLHLRHAGAVANVVEFQGWRSLRALTQP
jgi:inner membrane transporter RhtA